ncbi:hypothetical protein ACFYXF_00825 [Streptomyces sp. NPDC002680]|uniref:hypothetical protein n=1 Tax=Streptomyces sp. NPDC002680 TaxID=3364659 RepID=UPI0036CED41F
MNPLAADRSIPAMSSRGTAVENLPLCSRHIPAEEMLLGDWIPVRETAGGVLIAIADELLDRSALSVWLPGEKLVFQRAGRREIQELVVDMRLDEVADDMANALTRRFPEYVARTGTRPWQKTAACVLALTTAGTLMAGGLGIVVADPARRDQQPPPHRRPSAGGRPGRLERHRGRRPRAPAGVDRPPGGHRRLHDVGGVPRVAMGLGQCSAPAG